MLPKISQKRTDYGLWVCIDKTLRSSAPLREKTLISVVPTALLEFRVLHYIFINKKFSLYLKLLFFCRKF